jgi:hypothetical protein
MARSITTSFPHNIFPAFDLPATRLKAVQSHNSSLDKLRYALNVSITAMAFLGTILNSVGALFLTHAYALRSVPISVDEVSLRE